VEKLKEEDEVAHFKVGEAQAFKIEKEVAIGVVEEIIEDEVVIEEEVVIIEVEEEEVVVGDHKEGQTVEVVEEVDTEGVDKEESDSTGNDGHIRFSSKTNSSE
jgi:hypothetical protein